MTFRTEWIRAIRIHALAHYNENGWDYLVECYSDEDILVAMKDARNYDEALRYVSEVVELMNERRTEIQSEAY